MNVSEVMHAFWGGILIGCGAAMLLLLNGRIAGVSGILDRLVHGGVGEQGWRIAFLLGLIAPAAVLAPGPAELPRSLALSAASGCLSGWAHGSAMDARAATVSAGLRICHRAL